MSEDIGKTLEEHIDYWRNLYEITFSELQQEKEKHKSTTYNFELTVDKLDELEKENKELIDENDKLEEYFNAERQLKDRFVKEKNKEIEELQKTIEQLENTIVELSTTMEE